MNKKLRRKAFWGSFGVRPHITLWGLTPRPTNIILLLLIFFACGQKQGEQKNTPPFITHVEILPSNPTLGARINLRIEAGDNEGDDIAYTITWFLNERVIGHGLEAYLADAQKDDIIHAEITPMDRDLTGETVRTSRVTIANSVPRITGAHITPEAIVASTGELTVVGEGIDPDGDSLSYFCSWSLNDTTQITDSSTTLQLADLQIRKGSVLRAILYASDNDTVSQPYTLEISVVNATPILNPGLDSIPYRPDSIHYQIPIVDPDGDHLRFELIEAPTGIEINEIQGIVYGTAADSAAFEIMVRATDTEGAYLDAKFTLTPPSN
jgi:hypothetical protein